MFRVRGSSVARRPPAALCLRGSPYVRQLAGYSPGVAGSFSAVALRRIQLCQPRSNMGSPPCHVWAEPKLRDPSLQESLRNRKPGGENGHMLLVDDLLQALAPILTALGPDMHCVVIGPR